MSNTNSGAPGALSRRDRRLNELASVEFVGSLSEAFDRYGKALRTVSVRWHTELGLASTDVRKALVTMKSRWLWQTDVMAPRRVRARRVARRLRRAQTLVAALQKRADQFPKQYRDQFLANGTSPDEANKALQEGESS